MCLWLNECNREIVKVNIKCILFEPGFMPGFFCFDNVNVESVWYIFYSRIEKLIFDLM